MINILAIDPGIKYLAYCLMDPVREMPVDVGTASIPLPAFPGVEYAGASWLTWATDFVGPIGIDKAYIEIPDHIAGEKSNQRAWDLANLAYIVGWLSCGILEGTGGRVLPFAIPSREWKGTATKERTAFEVMAAMGKRWNPKWSEHEIDAIGLALWAAKTIKFKTRIEGQDDGNGSA